MDAEKVVAHPFCQKTSDSAVQLDVLPRDALDVILSFLELDSYVILRPLSKQLRESVRNASHLRFPESDVLNGGFRKRFVNFSSYRPSSTSLTKLLHNFASLTELHLNTVHVLGDDLVAVLNAAPAALTIETMSIADPNLTYWCTDPLAFPRLRNLRFARGSIRSSLSLLLRETRNLKCLIFEHCCPIRDDQVRAVASLLGDSLVDLKLLQCLRLQSPVLRFSKLTRLSLMGCYHLEKLPEFACPALRYLNLSFIFRLTSAQVQTVLASLPCLRELIMTKCPSLSNLSVVSSSLEILDVQFCNNLHALRLRCPRLRQLDTHGCDGIQTLIVATKALENLSVAGLPVRRLEIYAPFLQTLNVSGCRRLDHCVIRCSRLETVHYHGSRLVALRFCKEVRKVILTRWSRSPVVPLRLPPTLP
jgi:hypothetical protein